LGVALSIDDYGTGYSSLSYLRKMPVQELKIDRGFIFDMLKNDNDAMIVSSTLTLAHSLGLSVVAEGVETEEAWKHLQTLGCDIIQGYYVSPPLPPEKFMHWIDESVVYDPRKSG
jgi:EAL domain-containing protein (putative c-di-GMP-specific phosphodiesterase class I)